jgi:predicted transcriptional regulator
MARTKTREVFIREEKGSFKLLSMKTNKGYDFDGLSALRKVLTKEKARMLDAIKYQKPISIYGLAKLLGRPFKAVMDDIKLLERFGFIDLVAEKTKNRIRHRPVIVVDTMVIKLVI